MKEGRRIRKYYADSFTFDQLYKFENLEEKGKIILKIILKNITKLNLKIECRNYFISFK